MPMEKRLISIVIPIHNEEKNISLIYQGIVGVFAGLRERYDYEIIMVNDGSSDGSWNEIQALAKSDERVIGIDFSRNFGKEIALAAGIQHARGDAIISLDADGQHPPELIPQFLEQWESGKKVVIGVRDSNQDYGFFKNACSRLFYALMNAIGETKIMPHSTDFRLIDRRVAEEFRKLGEKNRITRSLIDWLGFSRSYLHFSAPARWHGKRQYSFVKLVRLALNSFVSHSLFPLKVTGYFGIVVTLLSGGLGFFILLNQIIFATFYPPIFSGTAMLSTLLVFLIGIVLMALGLIALYIGNIHQESLDRPLYIVNQKINAK